MKLKVEGADAKFRVLELLTAAVAPVHVRAVCINGDGQSSFEASVTRDEELTVLIEILDAGLSAKAGEYSISITIGERDSEVLAAGMSNSHFRLTAIDDSGGFGGELTWINGGSHRNSVFPPSEWSVMRFLGTATKRPSTIQEVVDGSGLNIVAARSAIQRLAKRLKEAGVPEVLINIRRRGYMLPMSVEVVPDRPGQEESGMKPEST